MKGALFPFTPNYSIVARSIGFLRRVLPRRAGGRQDRGARGAGAGAGSTTTPARKGRGERSAPPHHRPPPPHHHTHGRARRDALAGGAEGGFPVPHHTTPRGHRSPPSPVLFRWRGCCGGCCDGCCHRFLLKAALLPPPWLRACLMSVLLRASHAAAAALPRTRVAYAKLSRHCQTVASSTAFYVLVMRCDASAWRIVWGSGTRPCDNVSRQNVP